MGSRSLVEVVERQENAHVTSIDVVFVLAHRRRQSPTIVKVVNLLP